MKASACIANSSTTITAAAFTIWSSANHVAALIAAIDFGAGSPLNMEAYNLSASSSMASPVPTKSSCRMRRLVARWDTRITDLAAACRSLRREGPTEAAWLRGQARGRTGALNTGVGAFWNISSRACWSSDSFWISWAAYSMGNL
jgi:hypothetical protein